MYSWILSVFKFLEIFKTFFHYLTKILTYYRWVLMSYWTCNLEKKSVIFIKRAQSSLERLFAAVYRVGSVFNYQH